MKKSLNEELVRIKEIINEILAGNRSKADWGDLFLIDIMQLGKQPLVSSRGIGFVTIKIRMESLKSLDQYEIGLLKQLLSTIPNIEQAIISKFNNEKDRWGKYLSVILSKFENLISSQQIQQIRTALATDTKSYYQPHPEDATAPNDVYNNIKNNGTKIP